jgi:high-affinity iron transporter
MARAETRHAAAALLALGLLVVPAANAGDTADGRRIYGERCAACHGDAGGGDGPAAMALEPKPRNFRDAAFWRGRSVPQLRLVVRDGRPGTMMAPFRDVLSDEEIDAVVAYVQSFRPGPAPGDGEAPGPGGR